MKNEIDLDLGACAKCANRIVLGGGLFDCKMAFTGVQEISVEGEIVNECDDYEYEYGDALILTGKHCPHCGDFLFESSLPQYVYQCITCDEDFFAFEAND